MFSTTVASRTSFTFPEVVFGAKFEMMYAENESGTGTILNLDKLNSFVVIPV
jgi:inward rectifier potassium channel